MCSKWWTPVVRPKTSKTLFGPVHFSVLLKNYININSSTCIWFSQGNTTFYFEDCSYQATFALHIEWPYKRGTTAPLVLIKWIGIWLWAFAHSTLIVSFCTLYLSYYFSGLSSGCHTLSKNEFSPKGQNCMYRK